MKLWLYRLAPVLVIAFNIYIFAYFLQEKFYLAITTGMLKLFTGSLLSAFIGVVISVFWLHSLVSWYKKPGLFRFVWMALMCWVIGPGTGVLTAFKTDLNSLF